MSVGLNAIGTEGGMTVEKALEIARKEPDTTFDIDWECDTDLNLLRSLRTLNIKSLWFGEWLGKTWDMSPVSDLVSLKSLTFCGDQLRNLDFIATLVNVIDNLERAI